MTYAEIPRLNKVSKNRNSMIARFVELSTPIDDLVFINPDQVTQLKDKDDVTHVHFNDNSGGSNFAAVHLPIREVAELLSGE